MFDLNIYTEINYHSIFNNLSCIFYYNCNTNYNFNHTIVYLIYESYFLNSKYYLLNPKINYVDLFININMNIYSTFLWKYNFNTIIYSFWQNKLFLVKYKNLINLWTSDYNIDQTILIINKIIKTSNSFQYINLWVDEDLFPYKNKGELFFFYKQIKANYFYINSIYYNKNKFNLYLVNKASIINYLILNNNYLLPFFLNNNWYNFNFQKNEYLYYSLPFYWDYDYIIGFFKFFNHFNIYNYEQFLFNSTLLIKEYNNIYLIFNIYTEFNRYKIHSIGLIIIILWFTQIYIFIIYYLLYKYIFFFNNFLNWFVNLILYYKFMIVLDYLYFYMLNPIFLYYGKSFREIVYWYCDIINNKNLNLLKNKKDCESNLIIFFYDFVDQSYIKYITFLLVSKIFQIVYIIIFIFIYNLIFWIYYNLNYWNFLNIINLIYLYSKIKILLNVNKLINIENLKNIWTKYSYIKLELINLMYQNRLAGNNLIFSMINWIYYKELEIFKFKTLHNKIEFVNNNWITIFNIYNITKFNIYYINFNKLIYNINLILQIVYYNKYIIKKFNLRYYFPKLKSIKLIFDLSGIFIYFFVDIIFLILYNIYYIILNIIYKMRYCFYFIIISIIIWSSFNINIILIPFKIFCLYEIININYILNVIYNNNNFFFFEWILYEKGILLNTINIKLEILKVQDIIWNNITVYINYHKRKIQNSTIEILWNLINPIYFIIFIFYELQIQWLIFELWKYFITSIIIKLYFNYMPFIYWLSLNGTYNHLIKYIYIYISYIFYWLKCYYTNIYIFILPKYYGELISRKIFKLLYFLIHIKKILYLIKVKYIYIILHNYKYILKLFNLLIYKCFFFSKHIKNIVIINNCIVFDVIEKFNINKQIVKKLINEYLNFYVFINFWVEIQNNLDIINSYIRINKLKIYKWNKYSKKKKYFRYFMTTILFEYFSSPTYKDNVITIYWVITDNSFLRINLINYWTNINIYIKYWYWIIFNYYKQIWLGFGPIYYWEQFCPWDINDIYQEEFFPWQWNIYESLWGDKLQKVVWQPDYVNQNYRNFYDLIYKNLFNLSKLHLNQFINYISIMFLIYSIIFCSWWNIYYKKSEYNSQYLWQNIKVTEKKNMLIIYNKLLDWSKILFYKVKKFKNYKLFNNIHLYYKDNWNYNNKENFKNYFILKKIKYIYSYLLKTKYLKKNILVNNLKILQLNNFIFKVWNKSIYKNMYSKYSEILYLVISYLYSKNYLAYILNKNELYKYIIPFNKNYYRLGKNATEKQKNFNYLIWNYFNILDKKIFFWNSPDWVNSRNISTIFYNYSMTDQKEFLEFTIKFPYEFYYFILIILYWFIYYKILVYAILWNQKYWIGPTIMEKREWSNILMYNFINIKFLNFFNYLDNINIYLINTNSANGLYTQQLTNIIINTNKYNLINYLNNYKQNLNDLININFTEWNFKTKLLIYYKYLVTLLIWFIIIINFYIVGYKLIYRTFLKNVWNNKTIKNDKIKVNIVIKLQSLSLYYKIKKMLWNNYIRK